MNSYLVVGNWNFKPCEKGLQVYRYNGKTVEPAPVDSVLPDVTVGQQYYDRDRQILYFTHESASQLDGQGAGGNVFAFRPDLSAGTLQRCSECPSMGAKPSYVWKDPKGDYLLVPHHAGRNGVVKIRQNAAGRYRVESCYDDTTLVLFRLNGDGSIAGPCDILYYSGTNCPGIHAHSHLHSALSNREGTLFVVCDKGQDRIYTLRIDRTAGKLIRLSETAAEDGSAPRYAAFHPSLPVVYVNFEEKTYLNAYAYDGQTGALRLLQTVPLLDSAVSEHDSPSDLVVSDDGRTLYASIRGADQIAVFRLDREGRMTRVQNISCGGKTPRGLKLTPDGTALLSANQDSGIVSALQIRPDGTLEVAETLLKTGCPGNLAFL